MMSEIEILSKKIAACRICIEKPIAKPLPHEPRPVAILSDSARIVICGQAPGNRVHQSGQPFTDPSGDRLREWLGVNEAIFYNPANFAIVPMGFCFPGNDEKGGDLPPRKECVNNWHGNVFNVMPQLELFLLVGGYAQKYHLGSNRESSLTETVRNWETYLDGKRAGRRFLPLPHPSWRNSGWIRKNPWFENELLPMLKKEIQKRL